MMRFATYLDLQIVVDNLPQSPGVVALDGVPITENGMARDRLLWVDHVFPPPTARVKWIFMGMSRREALAAGQGGILDGSPLDETDSYKLLNSPLMAGWPLPAE